MNHIKRFTIPALILSLLIGCSSCSSISIPFFSKKDKEKTASEATLPTDREHIHSGHHETSYSVKDLEEGVVTGDWTIESVNGEKINPDSPAYLKFVPKEKRVYGNNGCNTLNADYEYNQTEKKLDFSNVITTMRLCNLSSPTDEMINLAINNTMAYTWDHSDDEYFLHFFDETGRELMTLMHQNFDFLNGTWLVTDIDEEPISDPGMKLVIDIAEKKIHGNTGCNILNGIIDIDMETANTISFHDIITTRMACPNPENQTRLIVALEDAAHAKPQDANTVVLLNLLRKPVLTLKRM